MFSRRDNVDADWASRVVCGVGRLRLDAANDARSWCMCRSRSCATDLAIGVEKRAVSVERVLVESVCAVSR